MPWRGWVLCAATSLLWLLVGCVPDNYWPEWAHRAEGEVVVGTPSQVSQTLQGALTRMGVFVRTGHEGDALRLESMSKTGQRFTLLLYHHGEQGEQTRIRIIWDKEADNAFWSDLLGSCCSIAPMSQLPEGK